MNNYRLLTSNEIAILEGNGCHAEDWTSVNVAEDFKADYICNVGFYGEVNLGVFEKDIETTRGFFRHSGIRNATLRNVTIGDNCLIENIGNCISNYEIGSDCYINGVFTMETTEGATYGNGNMVSVLNEGGDGNVVIFDELTSQLAALMLKYSSDKEVFGAIKRIVRKEVEDFCEERGKVGYGVRILNTHEIINTCIDEGTEINGACRIEECTIVGSEDSDVYIGAGVICENSVIAEGSSINNGAKVENCFVGESSVITNGFSAENSVFFANSFMGNGESCAAFCGPFSTSHHKSTLLIGGMYSFYNAGSATNFSNHAYKMGPLHYGVLERGTKTASGSHILLPANIGAFSMCMGKITNHPDTRELPFSYVIACEDGTHIVPGQSLITVGLYRDIRKWPKRDKRSKMGKRSIINFEWLNPFTVGEICKGKKVLTTLLANGSDDTEVFEYNGCKLRRRAIMRGITLYDMAIKMFIGEAIKGGSLEIPETHTGSGQWSDLSGMVLPLSEEESLVNDIREGETTSVLDILLRFKNMQDDYGKYRNAYAYKLATEHYGLESITTDDIASISEDCAKALRSWITAIRKDAEKEFAMGDIEQEVLDSMLATLDKELPSENG